MKAEQQTTVRISPRPPLDQVKTAPPMPWESGATLLTVSMSEACSHGEEDSVVSEITLDAAFGVADECKDSSTCKKEIVRAEADRSCGDDVPLDGTLKSDFGKNLSEGVAPYKATHDHNVSLKQPLFEEKISLEFPFRQGGMNVGSPSLPYVPTRANMMDGPTKDERPSQLKESKAFHDEEVLIPGEHSPKTPRDAQRENENPSLHTTPSGEESRHNKPHDDDDGGDIVPLLSHQVADLNTSFNQEKRSRKKQSEDGKPNEHVSADPKEVTREPQSKETKRKSKHRRRRSTSSVQSKYSATRGEIKQLKEKVELPPNETIRKSQHRRRRSISSTVSTQANGEQELLTKASQRRDKKKKPRRPTSSVKREPPTDIPSSVVVDDSFLRFPDLDRIDKEPSSKRRHQPRSSCLTSKGTEDRLSLSCRNDNEEKRSTEDESSSHRHLRYVTAEEMESNRAKSPPHLDDHVEAVCGPVRRQIKSERESEQDVNLKPLQAQAEPVETPMKPPPPALNRSKSTPNAEIPSNAPELQDDEKKATIALPQESANMNPQSSNRSTVKTLWKRLSERSFTSLKSERSTRAPKVQMSRPHMDLQPTRRAAELLDVSFRSAGEFSRNSPSSSSSSERSLPSTRGLGSGRSLTTPPPTVNPQTPSNGGKARRQYSPTLVHDSGETMSYSDRVMQGKIGISPLELWKNPKLPQASRRLGR